MGSTDDIGVTEVLLEYDQGGEYLDSKACEPCAEGTYVFDEAATVAGVSYAADPSSCQSCPDENMAFDSAGTCECENGYVIFTYRDSAGARAGGVVLMIMHAGVLILSPFPSPSARNVSRGSGTRRQARRRWVPCAA